MAGEVATLKKERDHTKKMFQSIRASSAQRYATRTDDTRDRAIVQEGAAAYDKPKQMMQQEKCTEGRGPMKDLPLASWDHRNEKD